MTSWIREKDRDKMHQHLDELLDLYGEVMITSQKDWDRNVSNNYVLKSEVDRLVREEIENLLSKKIPVANWGYSSDNPRTTTMPELRMPEVVPAKVLEHRIEELSNKQTKTRKDLTDFIDDPKNIAKAVEGSMDKRNELNKEELSQEIMKETL